MWSTRKRRSGSRLGRDKREIPAFDTVSLHSNLGSPWRNYLSIITTDINVLHFGSIASKKLLKIRHWWLKNKGRKADFRFVERKFLAAINLTGSAEGALVPVLLRITHWTKSGLPVSPSGLFPPWGAFLESPGKVFGPVKPFLDHLYLKTEKCIRSKLLVWREPPFIFRICE